MNKHNNMYVAERCAQFGLSDPDLPVTLPHQYGQCGEDYLVLSLLRALATREGLELTQEKYLEIGANHPVANSATYLLHIGLGMTGVLVEANTHLISALQKARPHDKILNLAITPQPCAEATLFISNLNELSSLNNDFPNSFQHAPATIVEQIVVPAATLAQLIEQEFNDKDPLFVSIDVEGLDTEILESYSFQRRPYVIQIEASEEYNSETFVRISRHLTQNGYVIIAKTDVNQLAIDSRRLPRTPNISTHGLGEQEMDSVLEMFDLVSFDVFDTILFRRCLAPVQVFDWMEKAHNVPGFSKARVAAEAETRKRFADRGIEISLEEIYEVLKEKIPINFDCNLELSTESQFVYSNPSILQLMHRALQLGKKVIAISDIYLSSAQISGLLSAAGVKIDKIYSSSDFRFEDLGKYNGSIYPHVAEMEGVLPHRILHIGDNETSDILNAKVAGFTALHTAHASEIILRSYPSFLELHSCSREPSSGVLLGQIIKNRIEDRGGCGEVECYGYEIGGPLILGFIKFVIEVARREGIEHLALLARDGFIIEKALGVLDTTGLTFRMIPASRRMTIFPCLLQGGWSRIERIFSGHAEKMTQEEFLDILSLDIEGLQPDTKKRTPKETFIMLEPILREQADAELGCLLEALEPERDLLAQGRRFAWVDVGWSLSSITALNEILGCPLPAFFVGSNRHAAPSPDFFGYLFEGGNPESTCDSIMSAVEVIELIFSSSEASTAYLMRTEGVISPRKLKKAPQEYVRDNSIDQVHHGVLRFLKDIGDLSSGLDMESLRGYNRSVFQRLCSMPNVARYRALAWIPHDRAAGATKWKTIGDYWSPKPMHSFDFALDPHFDALKEELRKARKRPLRLLRDLLIFKLFRVISGWSPPLPPRMAKRFLRSATKRNPNRSYTIIR